MLTTRSATSRYRYLALRGGTSPPNRASAGNCTPLPGDYPKGIEKRRGVVQRADAVPEITCVVCGCRRDMPAARDGRVRTPQGWKVLKGESYCRACRQTSHVLRAVIVPVAAPQTGSWAELGDELRALWSETTRCANWLVSELYARDLRRQPDDERLAPMPRIYLYPEARTLFPRLPAQAVAALAQDVLRRYRATRYNVLWTRTASLASYRYPVALTLPSQAWSLHRDNDEQGRWIVSVRLSEGRWRLRLRGGAPMRRQAERLRQIDEGQAERGSLTIYEARSPRPSSRGDSDTRRIMVKIAAWLPKVASKDRSAIVQVRTDEQSMLTIGPHWRIDPAPIRGVLAADARRRSSLLANLQSARASGGRTDGIRKALDELSHRTRQRLFESCRTYAAHLAAQVETCRAREVHYDDRLRPELSHFPWELLRRRIAEKLDERGIRVVYGDAARSVPSERDGEHAA